MQKGRPKTLNGVAVLRKTGDQCGEIAGSAKEKGRLMERTSYVDVKFYDKRNGREVFSSKLREYKSNNYGYEDEADIERDYSYDSEHTVCGQKSCSTYHVMEADLVYISTQLVHVLRPVLQKEEPDEKKKRRNRA